MPWTYDNPPAVAQNWTDAQIRRCVDAANAVLDEGGSDEEAIYACIHAAGKDKPKMIEYKSVKATVLGIEDRTVTGIFCVHGNVDEGDGWTSSGDRSHPGLFDDFTIDGRKRVRFLWAHLSMQPPTATVDDLFEVSAVDLPPAVKVYAPDATGAVAIKRTYFEDDFSVGILNRIKAGALSEMSYSYDLTKWDFEEIDSSHLPIRNLYKASLYDVSDVNWGMNPATSADGSKTQPLNVERDMAHAAVRDYVDRLKKLTALRAKDGRVLSAANRRKIEESVQVLQDCIVSLQDVLDSSDPGKQKAEIQRLYIETQRIFAQLNGVIIS
jgi:phage head maturation protease